MEITKAIKEIREAIDKLNKNEETIEKLTDYYWQLQELINFTDDMKNEYKLEVFGNKNTVDYTKIALDNLISQLKGNHKIVKH